MSQLGFWSIAQRDPAPLALVAPDGREWSRGELLAEANRIAHGLRALGLGRGDCVALVLENCAEFVASYLAVTQIGMYLTPINHHLTGPEIAYILKDSGARVFIGSAQFAEACRKAREELALPRERCFAVGRVEGFRPFAELGAGQPDTLPAERSAGTVMNYTSGTTGKPKGVRRALPDLPPELIFGLMTGFLAMFDLKPEDANVHLCGSPLYHTAVLVFLGASLHMGHAVVLMERWRPEAMLELIQRHRVTHSHMVPTQFHRLLGLPKELRDAYDVSSLRAMVHAAAPCPVETKWKMLEWWGDAIYEYYAATEGGGTLCRPGEWREHPGTVGRAWPGAEIAIFDDEGRALPRGEVGTVYMLLGQAAFEYKDDAEKTRKSRIGNYFTVGDVGWLDEEGYLFLCDRKNDMIISGGANLYPAEIEAELIQHPAVADVAVFGIPNEEWGEEVKAVVELAEGFAASAALREEIFAFLKPRLARMKTPRTIDFVDALPRDPNGKLYKRKLRDPYWQDRARAI
jgi:long-chain acyl-CoA synthetase